MTTADSIYNAQSEALWEKTGGTWALVKPVTPLPPPPPAHQEETT